MAKASKPAPNIPSEAATAPAPETTQEHAGAGETQGFNGLRIISQREGFRRAGRAWGRTPIEIALADLSDEEIALLKAESMLMVEEITL